MGARVPAASGEGEVAARIRERRGGTLQPLDELLLHSPPLADGWNHLLGAIRQRIALPAAIRELVVLRVAVLNQAEYEWWVHEPEAVRAGLGPEQLQAIRRPDADQDPALDPVQRRVIAYTDRMTRQVEVPDELFEALRPDFSTAELVELTATVATYNMVSRFLVALKVLPS